MKKINTLITRNFTHERMIQLDQLTQVLESFLNIPLDNRVWPLLRKRSLTLMTDDPHFATQARFVEKALCKQINSVLNLKISGLDIKLVSLPMARKANALHRKKIKQHTAETINSIAEGIEDNDLRAVLERISRSATHLS